MRTRRESRAATRGVLPSGASARTCVVAALALLTSAVTTVAVVGATRAPAVAADPDEQGRLHLVTLQGPGTAGSAGSDGFLPRELRGARMLADQDRTLDAIDAPAPVYRWTTALNGYAVRLTDAQVAALQADPSVVSVERNAVRPLAGAPGAAGARGGVEQVALSALAVKRFGDDRPETGGAGTVVGIVDTGIAPESPLFAQLRHSRGASSYDGSCPEGEAWSSAQCNGKLVGARWYVDGFGIDRLSATSSLSPRDTDGHGTQMASIAVGNAGVPVQVGGERMGVLGGLAPDAQLAVYKACWGAPDPDDDGCATADLVTAIDDAVRDRVDVLSVSVGGPGEIDTVERALLGAAEAGIVVTAAAGNGGRDTAAAHPSPWVTTVGGTTGDLRLGRVVVPADLRTGALSDLTGAMLSRTTVGPARVVLGRDAAVDGVRPDEARYCTPGSLDARAVAEAIVVCERGRVGRTDKSDAVALADGAAMVLVNDRRDSVDLDVHGVPTVHLDVESGDRLVRWVRRHPDERLRLRPLGTARRPTRVAALSPTGDLAAGVLKPDLVAPATGVLGAVAGSGSGDGWGFVNGTSAATAYTAGVAATLLGRTGWSAAAVRSALATTAAPLDAADALRSGAGRLRADRVRTPGLTYEVADGDYRRWLEGGLPELNTPSALLTDTLTSVTRTVTNAGRQRLYFSSSARGFRSDVTVTPAALRLGPGERATYTITLEQRRPALDDGYVVWRGARGSVTRIPVVVGR